MKFLGGIFPSVNRIIIVFIGGFNCLNAYCMFAMLSLVDVSAEDLAYSNLRFFSEYCWRDIAGQVPNGGFHDEWYEILGNENRPNRLHIQAAREHAKDDVPQREVSVVAGWQELEPQGYDRV